MESASIEVNGGTPTVSVRGDLDFRSAATVRDVLWQALDGTPPDLTVNVDLVGVNFVDSTGLSALFQGAKRAGGRGFRIRLCGVRGNVRRLLNVSGFARFFEVDPDSEEEGPTSVPESEPMGAVEAGCLDLPGIAASVPVIRRRIEQVAVVMGFDGLALRDLLIAVSEAATNAMKHGSPNGEKSRIMVAYHPDGDRLVVEVTDEGPGFDPLAVPVPIAEQMREGGMGVFFIRTLMDEVTFERGRDGTTVQMVKYL